MRMCKHIVFRNVQERERERESERLRAQSAAPATALRGSQLRAALATKSALRGSQSAAPATKSAPRGSRRAAPATKSSLRGSQNAALATKSALQGRQSSAPATESTESALPGPQSTGHEILDLPRNVRFKVHAKCCACHEIYASRFTK